MFQRLDGIRDWIAEKTWRARVAHLLTGALITAAAGQEPGFALTLAFYAGRETSNAEENGRNNRRAGRVASSWTANETWGLLSALAGSLIAIIMLQLKG